MYSKYSPLNPYFENSDLKVTYRASHSDRGFSPLQPLNRPLTPPDITNLDPCEIHRWKVLRILSALRGLLLPAAFSQENVWLIPRAIDWTLQTKGASREAVGPLREIHRGFRWKGILLQIPRSRKRIVFFTQSLSLHVLWTDQKQWGQGVPRAFSLES